MKPEITCTAVVTLTFEVHLSQPWGGEATIDQVDKRAREEAVERVNHIREALGGQGMKLVGQPKDVRILLHTRTS